MDYSMKFTLDIFPIGIYVNDNYMADILYLKEVSYSFRMIMYTKEDHKMVVHYSENKAYRFKECGKGLYYLNIYNLEIITLTTESNDTNYYSLSTLNARMEYFTHAEIEGSYRSRYLQHLLGWPFYQQLINSLSKNLIINCPVLSDDARRSHAIYGLATSIFKWEMARNNPKHIEFKKRIPVQAEILKHHPELPLHMDIFFINGRPYFTKITGKVNYRTIRRCRGQKRKEILKRLQAIVSRNTNRGFQINDYYA